MLARSLTPLVSSLTLPTWLGEILISVGIAARTIAVFATAVAFGIFVAIKIGEGNPWIACGWCQWAFSYSLSCLSACGGS